MIIRLIRGRVLAGRESDFVHLCREQVADGARAPGLISFFPGYHRVDGRDRFVLASTWDSAESAEAVAGAPESPRARTVLADVAELENVEVYEAIEPTFRGIVDAPGGVVRVSTAFVQTGRRADLFSWLAANGQSRQPQRLVLGWAMGERQVNGRDQILAVSAWPSQLVIEALSEPGSATGLLFANAEDFVSEVAVEQYQAIGLELPDELADVGARRVLAARFATRELADAAGAALVRDVPQAGDAPISVAPLGAPGTATDVASWILVVRVSMADYPRAERLIADHHGDVVLATRESATADGDSAPDSSAAEGGLNWSASSTR